MGLTIHYGLGVGSDKTIAEVKEMVGKFRSACMDLPFAEVGELIHLRGDECDWEKLDKEDPNRWLLIQAQSYVQYTDDWHGVKANKDFESGSIHRGVSPKRVIAFEAWPGEGCEVSNFGLCLFPKTIQVQSKYTGRNHRLKVPNSDKWSWRSFCKTQYANQVSLEHFLTCHGVVVRALDIAKDLGFDVEVSDEGNYWENRDLEALAKEIGEWDQYLAAFAGKLKDSLGEGETIVAPITERSDFEHLEAEGQDKVGLDSINLKGLAETS